MYYIIFTLPSVPIFTRYFIDAIFFQAIKKILLCFRVDVARAVQTETRITVDLTKHEIIK